MLSRYLVIWIVFAGATGFAVGGSFVAAYQIPLSQHETGADAEPGSFDQKAKEKIADYNKPRSLWVPTDSVGLYTLALSVFTALLVVVSASQGYFLLRADKTARIAANAAAHAAEAQIAIEGGRLICQPTTTTYWDQVGQWVSRYPNSPDMTLNNRAIGIQFVLKNYGKTPATLREINAVMFKSASPPPHIELTTNILDLPNETVVAPGFATGGFIVPCRDHFATMADGIAIQSGDQHLWFHGRAVYDDVFGREGTHYFLYKLRPTAGSGSYVRYWDETKYRQKSEI